MYAEAGGRQPGLSRRHLEAMLSLTGPGRGGRGVDLPGGLRFRIVGELMQVVPSGRPSAETPPRLEVTFCAGCDDPAAVHLRDGARLRSEERRVGKECRRLCRSR